MATYYVSFTIDGKEHSTTGISSYPNEKLVKNDNVDYLILEDNAFEFIKEYKKERDIQGQVNPKTVSFRYTLE